MIFAFLQKAGPRLFQKSFPRRSYKRAAQVNLYRNNAMEVVKWRAWIAMGMAFLLFGATCMETKAEADAVLSPPIDTLCDATPFSQVCKTQLMLSNHSTNLGAPTKLDEDVLEKVLLAYMQATHARVSEALSLAKGVSLQGQGSQMQAMKDCIEVLDDAKEGVAMVVKHLKAFHALVNDTEKRQHIGDMRSWTSAALTDQTTCSDELDSYDLPQPVTHDFSLKLAYLSQVLSNALYLLTQLPFNASKSLV